VSKETEDRLRDIAVWYYENKRRISPSNLVKRVEFAEKAMSCAFELIALLAKDVQVMERREPRNRLWLPTSVQVDNDTAIRLR